MKWTWMGMAAVAVAAFSTTAVRAAEEKGPVTRERKVVRVSPGGGAYLGVSLADVGAEETRRLGLAGERGALVREVVEDSPAAKAGLKADDVIVEFEGEAVRSAAHLARLVRETPARRSVALAYVRGGARQQAQVALGEGRRGMFDFKIAGLDALRDLEGLEVPEPPEPPEPPEVPDVPRPPRPPRPFAHEDHRVWHDAFGMRPRLGIQVVELGEQLARHFKVEHGLLVSSVSEGSAAGKAGVRAGDIILKVDGEPVSSRGDLVRRVGRSEAAREVTLSIQRDGRPMDVRVQLEPRRAPRGPTT